MAQILDFDRHPGLISLNAQIAALGLNKIYEVLIGRDALNEEQLGGIADVLTQVKASIERMETVMANYSEARNA